MIFDAHIHLGERDGDPQKAFKNLQSAGIEGGIVFSLAPNSFMLESTHTQYTTAERLDSVLHWTRTASTLYPFLFIDPTEEDALQQVAMANERGIRGFKVICNNFYPGDPRAMKVYRAIAAASKPILFHSGILWDGSVSSKYNRPAEFEALLEVAGLRFALAHVSWPWHDECIALYGKFQDALSSRRELSVEMFIDICPGTPPIYREEVLTKLLTVGYDVENNILFGVDSSLDMYGVDYARSIMERDNKIYDKLGLKAALREKIYWGNAMRFLSLEGSR